MGRSVSLLSSAELNTDRSPEGKPVLPVQPTPFIGRNQELSELSQMLANPNCRLLTLVGPGGIGKSRLAIEAAAEFAARSVLGVYYASLQMLTSTANLAPILADALGIALAGAKAADAQLCDYLQGRQLLLLLDNYEQLLPSTDLLSSLLSTASGIKFLVTSREALNLQEEWTYPLEGMDVPPDENRIVPESYSAVQLFCERAQRVRRDFSPADELTGIVRICRLVEGMPLAIELAAVWTKAFPCEQIAVEIRHNLHFLRSNARNLPERHRSMQAIFDQSWALLSAQEQRVFASLSVFQGGFSYEAAEQVAQASMSILAALLDKSLLRFDPDRHYRMHELLRQYAAERLKEVQEMGGLLDRHCAYYADFIYLRTEELKGGRQRNALLEIAAELENIRAAWQRAVEQEQAERILKMARPLEHFYLMRSRTVEGFDLFEKAMQHVRPTSSAGREGLVLARIMSVACAFYLRTGRLEEMQTLIRDALNLLDGLHVDIGDQKLVVEIRCMLMYFKGIGANTAGNYLEAARCGLEAQQLAKVVGDRWSHTIALYVQTNADYAQGRYEAARLYAQQAYTMAVKASNRWFLAYIHNDLGNIARALGNYAEAGRHYQDSYALRKEFDDPHGMAAALNYLAQIAMMQGQNRDAEQLFWRASAIYQEMGDRGGLAAAYDGLGRVACERGEYEAAHQHLHRALQITEEMQFIPLMMATLLSAADLLVMSGQVDRGIELAAFVLHHSGSERETKERAHASLVRYQAEFGPEAVVSPTLTPVDATVPVELGQTISLQAALHMLQNHVRVSSVHRNDYPLRTKLAHRPIDQPLIDPLSARELEVLNMMASGHSNREIARKLVVTVGTVKSHVHNICAKLDARNRVHAVARARELQLL